MIGERVSSKAWRVAWRNHHVCFTHVESNHNKLTECLTDAYAKTAIWIERMQTKALNKF